MDGHARRAARAGACQPLLRRSGEPAWPRTHGTSNAGAAANQNTQCDVRLAPNDPYGNARGVVPAAWPGDRGYLGKPLDTSGLVQMGARYYDSLIGRFLSVDPVMDLNDPQQWAAYSYANSNPVAKSDPTGLLPSWGEAKSWLTSKARAGASSVGKFVVKYQAEIVGGVVGAAVGVGCLVGTAGWGSVACFAAAGAAGAAATNLWKSKVQKTRAFSWASLGRDMAIGAAIGGVSAGLGTAAGAVGRALAPAVKGLATSASRSASAAVSNAASKVATATSNARQAVARGATKAVDTVKSAYSQARGSGAANTAANTGDDLVDVWRTVGPDEAADIAATGAYRVQPGGEGKYFFPTQAQAENLANMYNKAGWPGPQTITRGQVPQSVLSRAEGVNAGTEGPGWFVRSPDVPSICNVQCVGVID